MLAEYWLYWAVPLIFLVIVIWVYRPSAKKRYKDDGLIPFDTGKNESRKVDRDR